MKLFIAEKPSLGRAIASALGKGQSKEGYIEIGNNVVTWCFGHILELKDPHEYTEKEHLKKWELTNLPIIPERFELKPTKSSYKQFKVIQNLLKKADEVVNAGDPDREGQLLIDEVLNYCRWNGPTQRVLISDLNETNVKKALNNLKPNANFTPLYYSAQSRQFADWLYGINLTRFYTLKAKETGYNDSAALSVGRVQTPILGLIVNRYEQHKNHTPTPYFVLQLIANYEYRDIEFIFQSEEVITSKNKIYAIQKEVDKAENLLIKNITTTTKKVAVPLPFSLVDLQKKSAIDFGFSPEKVLNLIQSLYENHKLLTYPRSDCNYLPNEHFEERFTIIENLKTILIEKDKTLLDNIDISLKNKTWNDKKVTAHHAIIPTMKYPDLSVLTEDEKKIYLTAAHRYLLQFTPEYIYEATTIVATANEHQFKANGNKIIQLGWKQFEHEQNENKEIVLPGLNEGIALPIKESRLLEKKTTPPPLFTDATLLDAITKISKFVENEQLAKVLKETAGLGTPATQADIIAKLFARNFLQKQKKAIIPTEKGIDFIKVLPKYLTLPDMTAYWELQLSEIEEKILSKEAFLIEIKEQLKKILEKEKDTEILIRSFSDTNNMICPKCGEKSIKKGKQGKNYYCSEKECDFSIFIMQYNTKLSKRQIENLLIKKIVKKVKLITKQGKPYTANLILNTEFKVELQFENTQK